MPLTDYPELGFGAPSPQKDTSFRLTDLTAVENIGKDPVFSMSPSIIHYGGFTLGNEQRQSLSIVNCSSKSARMLILPPESSFFRVGIHLCAK
jgi:hypothetical protein